MTWQVAVVPGDGIGKEVIPAALEILPSEVEVTMLDVGADRYLASGELVSDDDLRTMRRSDAVLFGAVGDPRVSNGVLERGIIIALRQELDLYVNLRPFPELGLVIVRENTEGAYCGIGERETDHAVEVNMNSKAGIERCARYAFDLAARRGRHVTLAHKTNVLVHAGSLWHDVSMEVATQFPSVSLAYEHADAVAYHLVTEPTRYDVILTDNLFGDLLSDVAAGVGGGLGKAASGNLHPNPSTRRGRCVGLFEPVHGSAPDIAGKGIADPSGAMAAARMMMEELNKEVAVA